MRFGKGVKTVFQEAFTLIEFGGVLLLVLKHQFRRPRRQLGSPCGFTQKTTHFHPHEAQCPGGEWTLRVVLGKTSPQRHRTFLKNITCIGAIRHGHQRTPQEFGLVLNQQPGEAFMIVFHFHIIIPPLTQNWTFFSDSFWILFGFSLDNAILHRQDRACTSNMFYLTVFSLS